MKAVFEHIVKSYHSLWNFKIHGNSIEVITPASTTGDMFVSVFITQKKGEYIVTDGGWVNDEYYGVSMPREAQCFDRLFTCYYEFYRISETEGKGKIFYYKKTNDFNLVPNLVYDLSNFISAIVSASFVPFVDEKEATNIRRFKKQANDYLATIASRKEIKFNSGIGDDFKHVRFSAVITKADGFYPINYITGSGESYFVGSIAKAGMMFDLIDGSPYAPYIKKKIAVINDRAPGYKSEKLNPYIDFLNAKNNLVGIPWSNREKIGEYADCV
ncbi:MAG: hypothetical protein LBJ01_07130 [Tannerella sp.]|jgi:hypothetical protein|nr:hypothetical protein [Tannerella sp.]